MSDVSDLQAALVSLLGDEAQSLSLVDLVHRARERIAELEPQLHQQVTFGMVELEQAMLLKLTNELCEALGMPPDTPLH